VLTVVRFVDNVAYQGGAILVQGGTVTLADCAFSNNAAIWIGYVDEGKGYYPTMDIYKDSGTIAGVAACPSPARRRTS